jgi:adenosylhomocysteinase
VAVYAWKGQTEEEFVWGMKQTLVFQDGQPLNMIMDDGAVLTRLVHNEYPHFLSGIRGVTEQTTSGVNALQIMFRKNELKLPAFIINNSVTVIDPYRQEPRL